MRTFVRWVYLANICRLKKTVLYCICIVWFPNPLTAGSDFFKSDGDPVYTLPSLGPRGHEIVRDDIFVQVIIPWKWHSDEHYPLAAVHSRAFSWSVITSKRPITQMFNESDGSNLNVNLIPWQHVLNRKLGRYRLKCPLFQNSMVGPPQPRTIKHAANNVTRMGNKSTRQGNNESMRSPKLWLTSLSNPCQIFWH